MRNLIISANVLVKLRDKHHVSVREIEQCFENKCGTYLEDTREDHQTDPPTLWFVAPTNGDRMLKVVFMFIDGNVHIKSAFDADRESIDIYNTHGK
ncbi:MAG: ADP-ribosyl-(dinitrogen reductase) hydrolase [Rubrivivax sp.]|nr:ADP-ribosyl-(dinitrogen reductase) hydrolase [Rubrivivax sp.]